MPQSAARAAAMRVLPKTEAASTRRSRARSSFELETGRLPWVQPWGSAGVSAPLGIPRNAATGRLLRHQRADPQGCGRPARLRGPELATFRQAAGLGGNVRKGERGTTVVYADRFVPNDNAAGVQRGRGAPHHTISQRFTVFNVDQCEACPRHRTRAPPPVATHHPAAGRGPDPRNDVTSASAATRRTTSGRRLHRVPPPHAFFEPMVGTGQRSTTTASCWGSPGSRSGRGVRLEKVRVRRNCMELSTSFRLRRARHRANGAARRLYSQLGRDFKEDNRAIVRAASAASKAAHYLLRVALPKSWWTVPRPSKDYRGHKRDDRA